MTNTRTKIAKKVAEYNDNLAQSCPSYVLSDAPTLYDISLFMQTAFHLSFDSCLNSLKSLCVERDGCFLYTTASGAHYVLHLEATRGGTPLRFFVPLDLIVDIVERHLAAPVGYMDDNCCAAELLGNLYSGHDAAAQPGLLKNFVDGDGSVASLVEVFPLSVISDANAVLEQASPAVEGAQAVSTTSTTELHSPLVERSESAATFSASKCTNLEKFSPSLLSVFDTMGFASSVSCYDDSFITSNSASNMGTAKSTGLHRGQSSRSLGVLRANTVDPPARQTVAEQLKSILTEHRQLREQTTRPLAILQKMAMHPHPRVIRSQGCLSSPPGRSLNTTRERNTTKDDRRIRPTSGGGGHPSRPPSMLLRESVKKKQHFIDVITAALAESGDGAEGIETITHRKPYKHEKERKSCSNPRGGPDRVELMKDADSKQARTNPLKQLFYVIYFRPCGEESQWVEVKRTHGSFATVEALLASVRGAVGTRQIQVDIGLDEEHFLPLDKWSFEKSPIVCNLYVRDISKK